MVRATKKGEEGEQVQTSIKRQHRGASKRSLTSDVDIEAAQTKTRKVDYKRDKGGHLVKIDRMLQGGSLTTWPIEEVVALKELLVLKENSQRVGSVELQVKMAPRAIGERREIEMRQSNELRSELDEKEPDVPSEEYGRELCLSKEEGEDIDTRSFKVGIRVNAVSCYGIITKMLEEWIAEVSNGQCPPEALQAEMDGHATFKGRSFTVHDIANAFLFFASDEAPYINGHNLMVDGGYSIHGREIADFRGPQPS
eukprot:Gb_30464 [translate_table: standard]